MVVIKPLGNSLSCTYAIGKFYTFLSAKKAVKANGKALDKLSKIMKVEYFELEDVILALKI
ncbi:hypothetical protein GCM10009001_05140 [Virgibacillus siamensis]|uniref:Uncharacterized protein n=1 Tax=Virgibacillus siamensis TaxID=480071 RepID=A0ABP3QJI0_9BACI